MIEALRLSLMGFAITFIALFLLKLIIDLMSKIVPQRQEESSISAPATAAIDKATIPGTHDEEEITAIIAALSAMGAVGGTRGGRIRIEKVSG
ncbi:MAG: OadG family protein [Firmicutes bacterium]|jgi:sodium pump decarboxylase gamma subunit|nr:OadG family protein [Bacillota bacterium]